MSLISKPLFALRGSLEIIKLLYGTRRSPHLFGVTLPPNIPNKPPDKKDMYEELKRPLKANRIQT